MTQKYQSEDDLGCIAAVIMGVPIIGFALLMKYSDDIYWRVMAWYGSLMPDNVLVEVVIIVAALQVLRGIFHLLKAMIRSVLSGAKE